MRGLIELEEHFPKGDRIECNHLIHFTVTYNLTNEKKKLKLKKCYMLETCGRGRKSSGCQKVDFSRGIYFPIGEKMKVN